MQLYLGRQLQICLQNVEFLSSELLHISLEMPRNQTHASKHVWLCLSHGMLCVEIFNYNGSCLVAVRFHGDDGAAKGLR